MTAQSCERRRNVLDMSLEEKVGQLLVVGFPGKSPDGARDLISGLRAGGIIYFSRNVGQAPEISSLSWTLQAWALDATGIPLFICADQEGGTVARLTGEFSVMPGAMGLGASGDLKLAEDVAVATGLQLRAAGINVNLAPVLDVNNNPDNPVIGPRSFGSDPEMVAQFGAHTTRGLLKAGVIPVGKHFPGHGNTSVDSHVDLPVIQQAREELWKVELRPFAEAIACGLPAIMTAHIVVPDIDPERPATLSPNVIDWLLRREMGFQGLVITDCLEMKAISARWGTAVGAVMAFKAGCDLVLISHTYEAQKEAFDRILYAVRSGEISEDRLNESVSRILKLKYAMALPNQLPFESVPWDNIRRLSRTAHARCITLWRNLRHLVPFGKRRADGSPSVLVLHLKDSARSQLDRTDSLGVRPGPFGPAQQQGGLSQEVLAAARNHDRRHLTPFGRYLEQYTGGIVHEVLAPQISPEEAVYLSNQCDYTVVLSHNARRDVAQTAFLTFLAQHVPSMILVATGDPFDIRIVSDIETYLCTYGSRPESMEALARVLAGDSAPSDRVPVELE